MVMFKNTCDQCLSKDIFIQTVRIFLQLPSCLIFLYFILQSAMDQEYFDEILCPSIIIDTGQKCGKPLQHQQKFCSECGCKVSPSWFVKQTTSPDVDICTGIDEDGNACGQQLDPSVKFCSNCGARSKSNAV